MKFKFNAKFTKGQLIAAALITFMGGCGIITSLGSSDTVVPEVSTVSVSDTDAIIKNVRSNNLNDASATEIIAYADIIEASSQSERKAMLHAAVKCYIPNFDSEDADNSSAAKFLTLAVAGLPELTSQGKKGNGRYLEAKALVREEPETVRYMYNNFYHKHICDGMPMDNG